MVLGLFPDPIMTNNQRISCLIKFFAPVSLKKELLAQAKTRNISLSSLLRLITSEYSKQHPMT
jgi:hypothetical protein